MLFITAIIVNIFYNVRKTVNGIKLYGFGNGTFILKIILSIIGYIIINKESNKKIIEGNENNESVF